MKQRKQGKKTISKGPQNKDHFIDLAQEAFEEADKEEEKRSVIGEVMEALIVKTGAPSMAEAFSEQWRSQDVIEKAAEMHENRRRLSPSSSTTSIECLKESTDHPEEHTSHYSTDSLISLAEYSWRLFRLLLLASLVGLVSHFFTFSVLDVHPT
ncbi:hypothetical protein BY458DRAFT_503847 [Sporodiniella umbellata]|nr:hypothetical protein BY458DRAFT_503847 [Sporodiniella umbellata]